MKKETIGKVASDLQQKNESHDVRDIQLAAQKDYMDNLVWAVRHEQKKVDCSHLVQNDAPGTAHHQECAQREPWIGDHYIVVTCKKEKVLHNVLRNLFHTQRYCPTPTYDQSVYKYHAKDEKIEYLWTIPDVDTCEAFIRNPGYVRSDEQLLLEMIMQFDSGLLLKKAKALNGE